MNSETALRTHLSRLLEWHDAHVDFDAAVKNVPPALRGRVPEGTPHSPWQLVEHIRIAQHDILDFCVNPRYEEMKWPDDYWPPSPEPPSANAWNESLAAYRQDRETLRTLVQNPETDLSAKIPHGQGQTFLREVLLVADHTAYHVGQLVTVRQQLGIWPA